MSKKYSTDGFTVTNGNGFMGIFSATNMLNEKIERIEKLEAARLSAQKEIDLLQSALKVLQEANDYYVQFEENWIAREAKKKVEEIMGGKSERL